MSPGRTWQGARGIPCRRAGGGACGSPCCDAAERHLHRGTDGSGKLEIGSQGARSPFFIVREIEATSIGPTGAIRSGGQSRWYEGRSRQACPRRSAATSYPWRSLAGQMGSRGSADPTHEGRDGLLPVRYFSPRRREFRLQASRPHTLPGCAASAIVPATSEHTHPLPEKSDRTPVRRATSAARALRRSWRSGPAGKARDLARSFHVRQFARTR